MISKFGLRRIQTVELILESEGQKSWWLIWGKKIIYQKFLVVFFFF